MLNTVRRGAFARCKASVLELGIGCGNIAPALAQMGHDVTGLDIEARFIEIVRRRAEMTAVEINLITTHSSPLSTWIASSTRSTRLSIPAMTTCDSSASSPKKLKPAGKLVLAGVTIDNRLPYPWGMNPFGMAA